MIEAMIVLVVLGMGASLTYLATAVDPLFGWALVGVDCFLLLIAMIVLLKGDNT